MKVVAVSSACGLPCLDELWLSLALMRLHEAAGGQHVVSDGLESGRTRLPALLAVSCVLLCQAARLAVGLSVPHRGVMAWLHLGLCIFLLLLCTAVPQFPSLKTVQTSSLGSWASALEQQV